MKTRQCLNKNGEGCRKWLPADDKHFGNYPAYNDMGVKVKTFYKLCIECKHIKDATYQRGKGKGKLNKKELMHAGYDSEIEKEFLGRIKPTEVERTKRYECI
jgi:hypothetical protein